MVSSSPIESENIELVLSVNKADLERQLKDVFGGSGGLGGGGGMSDVKPTSGESGGKGVPVQPGAGFIKHLKHLAILIGIPLSLAALIKSSKLMAGTLGALQSIMGAMVDSFLAPFMPKIAEGIGWLAEKGIPAAVAAGEKTLEAIRTTGMALGFGEPSGKEQRGAAGSIAVRVADELFPAIGPNKKGVGTFWRDVFGGGPNTFEQTDLTRSQRGAFLGSEAYQRGSPESNRNMLRTIREGRVGGSMTPSQMWPPANNITLNIDAGNFEETTRRTSQAAGEAVTFNMRRFNHYLQEYSGP